RLGDGAIVGPPGERGRGIQQTIDSLATLTSLAGIVALFVAAFVVYNTMSMAVAERRREISMALALGAMRRQVFVSLIGEAAAVGMAASLAGVLGGWALAKLLIGQTVEQYGAVGVQAGTTLAVNQAHLLAGFVGGIVVAVAGSTLPARSVRSVAPIEFLRPQAPYEPAQPRGAHSARVPASLAVCAGVAGLGVLVAGAVTSNRLATSIGLLVGLGGVTSLLPRVIPTGMRLLRAPLRRLAGLLGRIAADSLGNNPGRTSLTVGALALTLAMVIGVGSAIGSYQKRFNEGASRWFRASLYVMPESYNVFGADQPFPLRLRDAIEDVPAVAAAYPESYTALDLEGEQLILYRASIVESFRDGRRDLWTPALTDQGVTAIEEKVRRLAGGGVLLSSLAARERDLGTGDSFALPTPDGTRDLPVAGIFDDMNSLQSVYIDYYEYGEIWDDWTVDRFSVLLAPGEDRDDAAAAISSALGDRGLDARVATPEELIGFLADATDDVFAVARLVQVAALIIAGFAIANTMFISVYQRRWELGLQRVLGMSTRQTTLSIVLESGAIGVLGSGTAVALGTGLGALMLKVMTLQYEWQVPFRPDVVLPLSAVLVGVGIASVAGLYPARLATRPAPIDVLRFE
ncbi:MAG: ABC transporter permease, partial [Actinomycetota bacterium]|nr:ABC transporter permease [Actinomycetota bacterium]